MNFALEGDTSGQISLQQLTHRLLQENHATAGDSAAAAEQALNKSKALAAQNFGSQPKQISADDLAASYNIMRQQVEAAQNASNELFATAFKGAQGVNANPTKGMPDVTQPISLTSLLSAGAQQQ